MVANDSKPHKGNHAPILVRICAPPLAACDQAKTWWAAAGMIARRLTTRYGDAVQTDHIELCPPESFSYPEIMRLVETHAADPPYVTIDGALVLSGGKLSEAAIRRELDRIGVSAIS